MVRKIFKFAISTSNKKRKRKRIENENVGGKKYHFGRIVSTSHTESVKK